MMKADLRSAAIVCGALAGIIGSGAVFWRLWKLKRGCRGNENPYETCKLVDEYMSLHYAAPSEYFTYTFGPKEAVDFPLRCAQLCKRHKSTAVISRALDVGCAVGRSTFELATDFDEVIGIDFSQAFIDKASDMVRDGSARYCMTVEGDLTTDMEAKVSSNIERNRVRFNVGDACSLPDDLGQFGLVLAANLICRLPRPLDFLNKLKDLVVPAGILVITSPYTWLEQYTPKSYWIAGFMQNGERKRGFDALKDILSPDFILLEEDNMPFLIRETYRKHQWTVAHATVWMRRIQ